MKAHPIKPKTNQSKPNAKRQMEILMTFLNENWNERNEMKNIHIHLFLAYFSITKRYQIKQKQLFKLQHKPKQSKTKENENERKSKTFIARNRKDEEMEKEKQKQNIQVSLF